jgi:hypothetical protein
MKISAVLILALLPSLRAHDVITTAVTFDREISRIVLDKCASCHHPGGSAFSMLTYGEARPWAVAVKEEILRRRMPPWGAVKGFGEFRNDQGLTAEEFELFLSWIDGGTPEGNEKDLPPLPKFEPEGAPALPKGSVEARADFKLTHTLKVDGILPNAVPANSSMRIYAEEPNGDVQPMLWLESYNPKFPHPFLFREPLSLPAGTIIRGIDSNASLTLLTPSEAKQK